MINLILRGEIADNDGFYYIGPYGNRKMIDLEIASFINDCVPMENFTSKFRYKITIEPDWESYDGKPINGEEDF